MKKITKIIMFEQKLSKKICSVNKKLNVIQATWLPIDWRNYHFIYVVNGVYFERFIC